MANITIKLERIGPNWWRVGEVEDDIIQHTYEVPVGKLMDWIEARAKGLDWALPTYATDRPGDQAAIYAEETGCDYATALVRCNMD